VRRAERLARDGKIKKVLVHEISRIAPMKMRSQRVRESNPCTSLERAVS
jgi:hypothetical protein